jgi:hypothetical protein
MRLQRLSRAEEVTNVTRRRRTSDLRDPVSRGLTPEVRRPLYCMNSADRPVRRSMRLAIGG